MGAGSRVAVAAAATGIAALGYGLWEAGRFTVRRLTLPVLRRQDRPIRVLHLSDLHVTPAQLDKLAFLRRLDALAPDLVVNTGDNLAHVDAVPVVLDVLEPLLQRPGVFVRGSNDYLAPAMKNPLRYLVPGGVRHVHGGPLPWEDLHTGFVAAGWSDLDDAQTHMDVEGLRIHARGVDDPHIGRDNYAAVQGCMDEDAGLRLGVTHAPYRRVLDAMIADRADLVLAGHTHGGQVCVPGKGALVTNCDLPPSQARGLSRYETNGRGCWLHVSAGLGTSPFAPVRVACRPEVSLLTLVPVDC